MGAIIAGHIKDLSIGLEKDEKHIFGPPRQVDYFCSGFEAPPSRASYFLDVYCEQSQLMRSMLLNYVVLYDVKNKDVKNKDHQQKELINRFADIRSLVSFTAFQEKGKWDFFIAVMLKKADFANFADFVDSHFYADLEYLVKVPFYGFSIAVESEQSEPIIEQSEPITTKDEFYSGKAYL